jgi:C-terminal processing protease CtpA/Prc
MIKHVNWCIIFALLGCVWSSSSGLAQTIPVSLLQEDFRIMRHALEQAHGGIYRYTSKAEMDRTFERALQKIDHPMTDLEFWRLVAPVVAHIKCGHTSIRLPKTLQTQMETTIPRFPLIISVLGARIYISQDLVKADSHLEGSELVSINDVPAKNLLNTFRTVVTGDGNTSKAKDYRISHYGWFLDLLYAFGIESPFRVVYRDRDGKHQSATLAGLEMPAGNKAWEARNPAKPEMNAGLMFLDDGNIAVLTIRHWYEFADPKRKISFSDFLRQSFLEIQQRHSTDLIIDLRDNDGGLDAPGKQLFSFLWDKPFHYDADINANAREFEHFKYAPGAKPLPNDLFELQADGKWHHIKHPNLGVQQPSQPNFRGRVFALMNGGSFSTSAEFLAMLHFHRRATFIGEEEAGGYYGCTAGRVDNVILPNSKLQLGVGLVTYYQAVSGYKYRDRGVLPDYPVSYTIAELRQGKDKEMDLAIRLAHEKRSRNGDAKNK